MKRYLPAILILAAAAGIAQVPPREAQEETVRYGQGIADAMKGAANSDASFFALGLLRESLEGRDLAGSLKFPENDVVVVRLTGAQLRTALERSVSLFPSSNPAYLFVSGIEAEFNSSGAPDKKIGQITVNGAPTGPGQTYRIAMPGSLARGGLGYFTVWGKAAVEAGPKLPSLESMLAGKGTGPSEPRIRPSGSAALSAAQE